MLLILSLISQIALASDCNLEYARLLRAGVPSVAPAPDQLVLPASSADIKAGISLARKSWVDNVKIAELKRKLLRITTDTYAVDDYLPALEKAAAEAHQLIDAQIAFSAEHAPTSELKRLSATLDQLVALAKQPHSRLAVKKSAGSAESSLEAYLDQSDNEISAASPEELVKRLTKKLERLKKLVSDELPTPKHLGEALDDINELLSIARAQQATRPSDRATTAYNYLLRLRQEIQKSHAPLLQQAQDGDINYQQQKIFLNPYLKSKLEEATAVISRTLRPNSAGARRK